MTLTRKILTAVCLLAGSVAFAQLPPIKVYETGPKLEKPMVMTPFVEFGTARKMPDLNYLRTDGKPFSLKDYQGKLLILNVWATWCGPCIREIPELTKLQQEFKDSNIAIVGVSVDANPAMAEKFLKKYKMSDFYTVFDPNQDSGNVLPLTVVPTNFIVDGDGNIVGYLPGFIPWNDEDVIPFLKKLAAKYADRGSL